MRGTLSLASPPRQLAQGSPLAPKDSPSRTSREPPVEPVALRLDSSGRRPAYPNTKSRRGSSRQRERRWDDAESPSNNRRRSRAHRAAGEDGGTAEVKKSEVQLAKDVLQKEIEACRKRGGSLQRKATDVKLGEEEQEEQRKTFIVTFRLPFTVLLDEEENKFEVENDDFVPNIVDALVSPHCGRKLPQKDDTTIGHVLVGAPVVRRAHDRGLVTITEAMQEELDGWLRSEFNVIPIFLPTHRERYGDRMVFPLFHNSMPSSETGLDEAGWDGYVAMNEKFSEGILKEYSSGDLIWINDYPLMLLPKLLRKVKADIPVGFYLHCVFPSSEVYRILPQREEILRGVLSSNIVGFHNFEYAQNFLNGCIHILGLECSASCIEACEDAGGTTTKVVTVPFGIAITPYQNLLNHQETMSRFDEIRQTFEGKKVLLALDRLEERNGIPHKIMAFHKLLQKEPSWASKCVFLQLVEVPRTEEVAEDEGGEGEQIGESSEQQRLLQQVYQMCGEVNSKFGTIGHLPLHFLLQDSSRTDLCVLLRLADVMLDTPLRDMLSRSAHEFLCCQEEDGCGVLVMSEFSGSAQSLRAASLTVNPWDTIGFADSLQEALEMDHNDKLELHRYGGRYVREYTLGHWATNFHSELITAAEECENERLQIPPAMDHDKAVGAIRKARRRILVFGFTGTLLPPKNRISKTLPGPLKANLQAIADDPNTHLIVVSGHSKHVLDRSFQGVNCWIIAESGICYREPASMEWHTFVEQRDTDWIAPVKQIMEYFAARTPGSNVIEMSQSVSWRYRETQGDHAAIQSKDMVVNLWAGPLHSAPAEVVVEKDSVTVWPTGTGKALQLEKLLHMICTEEGPDTPNPWMQGDTMVVCVGDFLMRDEDIFATVQRFFQGEGAGSKSPQPSYCEHHPAAEAVNLQTNSQTVAAGAYDFSALRLTDFEAEFWGPGRTPRQGRTPRGGRSPRSGTPGQNSPAIPKKTPSEPDHWQPGDADEQEFIFDTENISSTPVLFTATVNRKATRAQFHLSDTNDVAFLIAQMAREMRQATKANEEERNRPSITARFPPASRDSNSGYQGLDALFG